jgi:hypothetical protein
VEKARHEVERVVDKPQAIEHHGFDSFPHGEIPQFRILVGGVIEDVANAEFVKHPRDKPQMIQDLRAVRLRRWHDGRAV